MKFSRWAFEKFRGLEDKLGTQMRAVGEVMSIGKNYKEAFQKAIRYRWKSGVTGSVSPRISTIYRWKS